MRMPGMDGVETFRQIRAVFPSVIAIFMTAQSSPDICEKAEERGAIQVLAKPLDPAGLIQLVDATLATAPVLIADDDPVLLKSMARSIESSGIKVETVTSLRQAARALRQRPNRVVVADVYLEDGFGYELLELSNECPTHHPFILISGRSDWLTSEMARQFHDGVICLTKPIDIDELIRQVSRS
jgi:DNA-binding NtrC family response regulator